LVIQFRTRQKPVAVNVQMRSLILCVLLLIAATVAAARKPLSEAQQSQCAMCHAMAAEAVEFIATKKGDTSSIDVGHRLKDRGYNKIPYRESEVFLEDVLNEVCGGMKNYAKSTGVDLSYSKYQGFRGEQKPLNLKGVSIDSKTGKELVNRCFALVEEKEDEMLSVLRPYVASLVAVDKQAESSGAGTGTGSEGKNIAPLSVEDFTNEFCSVVVSRKCKYSAPPTDEAPDTEPPKLEALPVKDEV
jgi:hypothetical protein